MYVIISFVAVQSCEMGTPWIDLNGKLRAKEQASGISRDLEIPPPAERRPRKMASDPYEIGITFQSLHKAISGVEYTWYYF